MNVCEMSVCEPAGAGGGGEGSGCRAKNKNPTQRCGEKYTTKVAQQRSRQNGAHFATLTGLYFHMLDNMVSLPKRMSYLIPYMPYMYKLSPLTGHDDI